MNNISKNTIPSIIILILLITIGFFVYRELENEKIINLLENSTKELQQNIKNKNSEIAIINEEKLKLERELGQTIEELEENEEVLEDLDKRNKEILNLITIEKELLQKYSKVSFLNEHYSPKKLSAIDKKYWAVNDKIIDVDSRIEDHLDDLLNEAEDDGIDLRILSAYRSFDTQASLKYNYLITYGSGANTFSADQGYSEHQLGTTVDFTTPEIGSSLSTNFENTQAFNWLKENAYKYGFIMSYPKGNTYYQYEPWHWRFVSKDLARHLNRQNKNFYDLEQREIWDYLEGFFD